ncbi:helix-turn-helix transcriptional regulator [Radicibacter daui]|uniref:helix-turn-helix transcriptional regulator n=1 Tax=Radicibacter daui TaxID=3064829 RepID=UPI004046BCA8
MAEYLPGGNIPNSRRVIAALTRWAEGVGAFAIALQAYRARSTSVWDGFPAGFWEGYSLGQQDMDRVCAVANAMRIGWTSYAWQEAWGALAGSGSPLEARRYFESYGMRDGLTFVISRARSRIGLYMAFAEPVDDARRAAIEKRAFARLLRVQEEDLGPPSFTFATNLGRLSEAEQRLMIRQILEPEADDHQLGTGLGISLRTVQATKSRAFKRLNCRSWAEAVMLCRMGWRAG